MAAARLKRALDLPMLTLYGLGTTIGAGIYALVGEIAGVAGYGAPLSFLIASIVAGFTACSFAELASRFPQAAGAALYVQQGFGLRQVALVVGLLVILAGVVSSAALVNGFTGYLQTYVDVPRGATIVAVTVALGALAAWGIAQSVTVAAVITVVETGALALVVAVGAPELAALPERWPEFLPGAASGVSAGAVLLGVTLAFYAFIGFEDMVDVAEEVKNVQRTLPRAILLTLGISTVLYLLLMTTALLAMTPGELAASGAPVATLFESHTGRSAVAIGVIAMFAIINGALVQIVMASRVLYGLSSRGQLPAALSRVHGTTRTPVIATIVAAGAVLGLAWYGRLGGLASTTSLIMLTIFAAVNLALWRIKGHQPTPDGAYAFPRAFPAIGFVLSAAFVIRELVLLLG
ncbi:MAG: APC family permease [Pseudomonadales bacterium]